MKDAEYIAELFLPWMKKLDPNKQRVDLLFFDGASNVQKAGKILEVAYPRVTCLHVAEHVVSLFFKDLCRTPEVTLLIKAYHKLYAWFSSGSHHAPHAVFKQKSKQVNSGRWVGLLRAADTRMAGYLIAFLRMLRLKDVLMATVSSEQLVGVKQVPEAFKLLFNNNEFWTIVYTICKAVYPMLRLLRLCDSKQPSMDKLHYFYRKITVRVKEQLRVPNNELDRVGIDSVDAFCTYNTIHRYFCRGIGDSIYFPRASAITDTDGDLELAHDKDSGGTDDEPNESDNNMEDYIDCPTPVVNFGNTITSKLNGKQKAF